jgi:transcriptional regulator with XRE-family HTH domain
MTRSNLLSKSPPTDVEKSIMSLGKRLRIIRLRRNMTIAEVAERIGTGPRAVMDAEKGKPSTSIVVYAALLWLYDQLAQLEEVADTLKDNHGLLFLSKRGGTKSPNRFDVKSVPVVYFIGANDIKMVKIGKSKNVEQRIKDLQLASPVALSLLLLIPYESEEDAYKAEREFHNIFNEYRASGEWFNFKGDLKNFITSNM